MVGEEQNHFFDVSKLIRSIWNRSKVGEGHQISDGTENVGDSSTKLQTSKQSKVIIADKLPKVKNMHLKRKSRTERVFVPPETKLPSEEEMEPAKKRKKVPALNFPYYNSKLL